MMRVREKTGTEDELRRWLASADVEAWEAPQAVVGQPGRWSVRYVVDTDTTTQVPNWYPQPGPAVQRPWPAKRRWSRRRKQVVAVGAVAVVVALFAAGYIVVTWVMGHVALVLGCLVIAAVVVVLVLRALGGSGDCTVIHIRH